MTTTLKIDGMTCHNCALHVRTALQKIAGVQSAEVDLDSGRALVKGDNLAKQALVQAVERAGYSASEIPG